MHTAILCAITLSLGQSDALTSLIGSRAVTCPVCGCTFDAIIVVQPNSGGGVDRDLFPRAIGPQPEFYRIATCPQCLYSGYETDFATDTRIEPLVKQKLLGEPGLPRPDGFTPDSDQRAIHPLDRYNLAIRCYEWRHRSDEALGWLHLRASWVARDLASVAPRTDRLERVMRYARRWRPAPETTPNQADAELQMATHAAAELAEGRFTIYQAPFVRFFIALMLRRHGENTQAAPLLAALADDPRLEKPLRDAVHRMTARIADEQAHQRDAVAAFERALAANQPSAANRPVMMYLIAELHRRLGQFDDATRWYDRALASDDLPKYLRGWATQQRAAATPPSLGPKNPPAPHAR